jgi:hypothetical protein
LPKQENARKFTCSCVQRASSLSAYFFSGSCTPFAHLLSLTSFSSPAFVSFRSHFHYPLVPYSLYLFTGMTLLKEHACRNFYKIAKSKLLLLLGYILFLSLILVFFSFYSRFILVLFSFYSRFILVLFSFYYLFIFLLLFTFTFLFYFILCTYF